MGGNGGGFADAHQSPDGDQVARGSDTAEITAPAPNDWVDDPSLGGGDPDAALAAFGHYADADDGGSAVSSSGVLLADASPPPKSPLNASPPPPGPTQGTKPAAPAKAKPAQAKPAPAAKPKKQRDQWQKVVDTTDGKPGGYDIGWMKSVDPRVLKSIDGAYADDVGEAQVTSAIKRDRELARIEAERKKSVATIRKVDGTTAKKGAKGEPFDPIAEGVSAIYDQRRAAREAAVRAEVENNAKKRAASQTVSVPEQGKVRRADMQTLKRINYVSDVNTLSGNPEKTRKHLESMRAVKGTDTRAKKGGGVEKNPDAMMLSGDTADRFEMAMDAFSSAHPGFAVPTSSVGYGTRGLHETRQGLGYLGHMLGTSFDLFAAENPNLIGPDKVDRVNDAMLLTLARDHDPSATARTRMDYIADAKIMAMGKRTAANANNAEDAALEKQIRQQYREMSQTSTNVQDALDPQAKQELHSTQQEYFELEEARKKEAGLAAKAAKAPDDAALAAELAALRAQNNGKEAEIKLVLSDTFKPYQSELEAQIAAATDEQEHDRLQTAHDRFVDPSRVFGGYHKDEKTGALVANDHDVSNVSLMQYLDHGFVRDDGTDYAALKKAGKQGAVFNEDVVANLLRHGFQSGSYFGDTMHFDFVESQANLVPGGRNPTNMKHDRASPENELPDVVNVPTTPAGPPKPLPPNSVFSRSPVSFPATPPSILQTPSATTIDEPPNPLAPPKSILDQ